MSTNRFSGLAISAFATGGVREVTSKELHDGHAKSLSGVKKKTKVALALTSYREPFGFVLSTSLTEELATKAIAYDALSEDLQAAWPYLDAAVAAGASASEALRTVLPAGGEGSLRVDFAGLAALMSRTPVRMAANEDGTPIARVRVTGVASTGTGLDEDDYSAFDDEA